MHLKLQEKVSVLTIFNHLTNKVVPYQVKWRNRKYTINEIGLHHTIYIGKILHHIFSLSDGNTYFRINLNTENLQWTLEEVWDGIAD